MEVICPKFLTSLGTCNNLEGEPPADDSQLGGFNARDGLWYRTKLKGDCKDCHVLGFAFYTDSFGNTWTQQHPRDPHAPDENWHRL